MATVKKEVKTKFYVVVNDIGANDKCPPQSRLIVDTIKAAGGRMSREDLLAALKRPPDQGGLKTNQTAERILGFYKPKLTEINVLKEEIETKEIEVEVPDKPAKEAKGEAKAAAANGEGASPDPNAVQGETTAAPATGEKDKGRKGHQKTAA
jgi:hypothetical protein